MKLSRTALIGFILLFLVIAGVLYVARMQKITSLTAIQDLFSNKKKEYVAVSSKVPALTNEETNSKYYVRKTVISNTRKMYIVRGTLLTAPSATDGFYSTDVAIEGDAKKTPVKLILAKESSVLGFGELDSKGQLAWQNQKLSEILPKLKVGRSVEMRVIIELTDPDLKKALEPPMEALLHTSEITPTTYGIQPQMIALL